MGYEPNEFIKFSKIRWSLLNLHLNHSYMKLKLFFAILLFYACIDDDQIFIENDITPPSISIIGDNSINIYQNTLYVDAGATAIDNIDGDLTTSIITTGSVNTNLINSYTITYSVSDAANNSTFATRQVNVIEDLNNPVYLDSNEITIKAKEWSEVGDVGYINDVLYTVVDREMLAGMLQNGSDVTKIATTKITNMSNLFYNKTSFNQNIGNWDVSNVISMYAMFWNAASFNQSIAHWDVSNVSDFINTFTRATNFNQNIEDWNVSNGTTMRGMFSYASSFNQPLGNWDVSNVDNMNYVFYNAILFNQDISNWDVGLVEEMFSMFNNASSFNQDLSNWNVENVFLCENFDDNTPQWVLPIPNFVDCNIND